MVNSFFYHVMKLLVIVFLVSGILSIFLQYVPYSLLAFFLIAPVFGAFRMQQKWTKGIVSLIKVFRFSIILRNFYLTGFLVILLSYSQIFSTLVESLMLCLGGILGSFLIWEGVRILLKKWKSIEVISFMQAFKNAW